MIFSWTETLKQDVSVFEVMKKGSKYQGISVSSEIAILFKISLTRIRGNFLQKTVREYRLSSKCFIQQNFAAACLTMAELRLETNVAS